MSTYFSEVFSPPMHWSFLHNKAHSWSFFTTNGFLQQLMEFFQQHPNWFFPKTMKLFPQHRQTTTEIVFAQGDNITNVA